MGSGAINQIQTKKEREQEKMAPKAISCLFVHLVRTFTVIPVPASALHSLQAEPPPPYLLPLPYFRGIRKAEPGQVPPDLLRMPGPSH